VTAPTHGKAEGVTTMAACSNRRRSVDLFENPQVIRVQVEQRCASSVMSRRDTAYNPVRRAKCATRCACAATVSAAINVQPERRQPPSAGFLLDLRDDPPIPPEIAETRARSSLREELSNFLALDVLGELKGNSLNAQIRDYCVDDHN